MLELPLPPASIILWNQPWPAAGTTGRREQHKGNLLRVGDCSVLPADRTVGGSKGLGEHSLGLGFSPTASGLMDLPHLRADPDLAEGGRDPEPRAKGSLMSLPKGVQGRSLLSLFPLFPFLFENSFFPFFFLFC